MYIQWLPVSCVLYGGIVGTGNSRLYIVQVSTFTFQLDILQINDMPYVYITSLLVQYTGHYSRFAASGMSSSLIPQNKH